MREWLKKARESKGLSQKDLANMLDISESYYCYIEKGERQKNLDITLVSKLSAFLCLSIPQIVEFEIGETT